MSKPWACWWPDDTADDVTDEQIDAAWERLRLRLNDAVAWVLVAYLCERERQRQLKGNP